MRCLLASLCALSCAAACGGQAVEDPKPQGSSTAGAPGAPPSSGGNSGDPPPSAAGSPSKPEPLPDCPYALPVRGAECDSGNGPNPVCVYADNACGTTATCAHNQWHIEACTTLPEPEATCAAPALPSGLPSDGQYCPGNLEVVFAQPLSVAGDCWEQQVAVSCTAGSSSEQACWVDTSTNLLYRLAEDPCMPDPKWRECTDVEYDNSMHMRPNCVTL